MVIRHAPVAQTQLDLPEATCQSMPRRAGFRSWLCDAAFRRVCYCLMTIKFSCSLCCIVLALDVRIPVKKRSSQNSAPILMKKSTSGMEGFPTFCRNFGRTCELERPIASHCLRHPRIAGTDRLAGRHVPHLPDPHHFRLLQSANTYPAKEQLFCHCIIEIAWSLGDYPFGEGKGVL